MNVGAEQVESYRRDGVVALRGVFAPEWLDLLRDEIHAALADPGSNLARHTSGDGPAYYEDFWSWSGSEAFTRFVRESPAAELAAKLLGAESINLVMDNWFVREAGSASRPPFHHDISYFDFAGTMCVLWLPLEAVTRENGISFVRGSHLWEKHFMRVRFGDGHRSDVDGHVTVNGIDYEPAPDVASDPDGFELVDFDLELGDCLFFDMRTLHGGLSTVVPDETVHRYTLRMTAPDGRIQYRGDWAAEERAMFEAAGYREGDALAGRMFPQLYP